MLFTPNQPVPTDTLGLLGELAQKPCLFETFRNPVTPREIKTCLSKLYEVQNNQIKEAQKKKQTLPDSELTRLWILTPTLSEDILNSFAAEMERPGLYCLPSVFQTGIIVINQLPVTKETLWLRILGKSTTQQDAITELEALPEEHPHKKNVLKLINKLLQTLAINKSSGQVMDPDDLELIKRLDALSKETLEKSE